MRRPAPPEAAALKPVLPSKPHGIEHGIEVADQALPRQIPVPDRMTTVRELRVPDKYIALFRAEGFRLKSPRGDFGHNVLMPTSLFAEWKIQLAIHEAQR